MEMENRNRTRMERQLFIEGYLWLVNAMDKGKK
jgi:hypothetical protein